jgi:hypothetical protein
MGMAGTCAVLTGLLLVCRPIAADEAKDACSADVAALSTWLCKLAERQAPPLSNPPHLRWVTQAGEPSWPKGLHGPLVELRLRKARLNGEPLPDSLAGRHVRLSALRKRHHMRNRLRGQAGKTTLADPVLLLAVDADEGWAEVVDLCAAASQAGFKHLGLLVAHPERPGAEPPARSPIDGAMAEVLEAETEKARTKRLAQVMRELMSACPQLVETFSRLAWVDPEKRISQLAAEVPEAVGQCGCKPNRESIRRLIAHIIYVPPLSVFQLRLAGVDETGSLNLRMDAKRSWSQALPALQKALAGKPEQPVSFDLK